MAKNSIRAPKGTRDFYPEEQGIQNYIFDTWKEVCQSFGYEDYEGPMFEHLELFTAKSGDEIVTQLYNFKDKGGRDIALRPEMTPTLARLVNQKGRNLRKPFKWFSIPRLFRYERAQKGRLREFFQLNMDIVGTDSINAETDLITAICELLQNFQLDEKDFLIGISSRRLLVSYLQQIGIENADPIYPALDKRAKISEEAFFTLLEDAGANKEQSEQLNEFMACKDMQELSAMLSGESSKESFGEIKQLFANLDELGLSDFYALDLSVVRGLAYYTGIVFEVFDKNKSMRAIAGGGRYDNLCAILGGEAITGVGFGMGDVVLKDLLHEQNLLPERAGTKMDYWIVSFENNIQEMFALAKNLRAAGFNCSHALDNQKIKKQLESANNAGAAKVIFIDSDKNTGNSYEVKDLTTGEQNIISLTDILTS